MSSDIDPPAVEKEMHEAGYTCYTKSGWGWQKDVQNVRYSILWSPSAHGNLWIFTAVKTIENGVLYISLSQHAGGVLDKLRIMIAESKLVEALHALEFGGIGNEGLTTNAHQ